MKRLLVVLFLGLVAVAVVTPYLFGVEAERIFEQQMTLLNSSNKIRVAESRFRRGWFGSTAETTLELADRGIDVFAEHTIEHGPFPVGDPLKYLLTLQPLQAHITSILTLPDLSASGEPIPLGTLTTLVNFDGTTDSVIDIPASDAQLADTATVAWGNVRGSIDFEPARASWQGSLDVERFDWTRHESSFSLGKSTLDFLTFPGRTGLAMGRSTLVSEVLKARLPGSDHVFESSDMKIDSSAEEQGQSVRYSLSGGFSSARLPDLELNSGKWRVSAGDLDLDTLTELNDLGVAAAIPLNKLFALVSKRNANLDSALTLSTDSGALDATAMIELDGGGSTSNPIALIGALNGDVTMEFPPAIAELAARAAVARELSDPGRGSSGQPAENTEQFMADAAAARIESWLNENLLTRSGDRYRFQASIRDGALSVNGEPFNILSLLR